MINLKEIHLTIDGNNLKSNVECINKNTENYYTVTLDKSYKRNMSKVLCIESKTMLEYIPFINGKADIPNKFNICDSIKLSVILASKEGEQYSTTSINILQK